MILKDIEALGVGKADREVFNVPEYADGWNSLIDIIEKAPIVEVEPVKYARYNDSGRCTACGSLIPTDDRRDYIPEDEVHYCYYCGAKIKKAVKE